MIYLELFLTFLSIGAFTFGGGYAMLPLIQNAVLEKGWLTESEIINFIAVSESTPGPFAINIATYVGMVTGRAHGDMGLIGGFLGSFFATSKFSFVSFPNNSSKEQSNIFVNSFNISIEGSTKLFSHLDTACAVTYTLSASSF